LDIVAQASRAHILFCLFCEFSMGTGLAAVQLEAIPAPDGKGPSSPMLEKFRVRLSCGYGSAAGYGWAAAYGCTTESGCAAAS